MSHDFHISEAFGYLFETSFALGCLSTISQQGIAHPYGNYYTQQLDHLTLPAIRQAAQRIGQVGTDQRHEVADWVHYVLWHGWVAGYTFMQELLDATVPSGRYNDVRLHYFQAHFANHNSLNTHIMDDSEAHAKILAPLLSKTPLSLPQVIADYQRKGHFLRADILLLLECAATPEQRAAAQRAAHEKHNTDSHSPQRVWHLVALDVSRAAYGARNNQRLPSLQTPATWRSLLQRDVNYLSRKSTFASLSIASDPRSAATTFPEGLRMYFSLFAQQDRETLKLIQAASYAYSFFTFLQSQSLLPKDTPVIVHAIGFTGHSANALTVWQASPHDDTIRTVLEPCTTIYRNQQAQNPEQRKQKRHQLLRHVCRNARQSFTPAVADWFEQLQDAQPGASVQIYQFSETVTGFYNTAQPMTSADVAALRQRYPAMKDVLRPELTLRDAHAACLRYALTTRDDIRLIFATGNPGIGKTTAVVRTLIDECLNDGFLLLYASPRTQVNRDLWNKFMVNDQRLCDESVLLLTSDSDLIEGQGGKATVLFRSDSLKDRDLPQRNVTWVDHRHGPPANATRSRAQVRRYNQNTLTQRSSTTKGVLYSLCHGLGDLLQNDKSRAIVATVAIQALKQTRRGTTLEHLKAIFKAAYNQREHAVLPAPMRTLAQQIKTIVIMLDEITGDESGVAFLHEVLQWVETMHLVEHGFRVKIVVADASITEPDIIAAHLSSTDPERDKIYYRTHTQPALPLSMESMIFKQQPALTINANSFPATELTLHYHVFSDMCSVDEMQHNQRRKQLSNTIYDRVIQAVRDHLDQHEDPQLLVYIQDKRKLEDLELQIGAAQREQGRSWEKGRDYLIIHADTTEHERSRIHRGVESARVIFMTSSASRGLSFPQATHILVVVPTFALEQNLMEIVQVIYRGRGNQQFDTARKTLSFYLGEHTVYDADDESDYEDKRTAAVLNIATILVLLKTVVMTRIAGYGRLGREQVALIPIGGKAVSAVGDALNERLSDALRLMRKQLEKNPRDTGLRRIVAQFEKTLQLSDTTVAPGSGLTYLELTKSEAFRQHFLTQLETRFSTLLAAPALPMERAYVSGSLLYVPVGDRRVKATYTMRSWHELAGIDEQMLQQLWAICNNEHEYPDPLRTAVRKAADLINELYEGDITQSKQYQQQSHALDQFYCLPLFGFVTSDTMATHFAQDESVGTQDRELLVKQIRRLYSVGGILPIGGHYTSIPFLLFRSASLSAMRRRLYSEEHIVSSHLFNLLLVMLAKK